jgi:hypothetical protein
VLLLLIDFPPHAGNVTLIYILFSIFFSCGFPFCSSPPAHAPLTQILTKRERAREKTQIKKLFGSLHLDNNVRAMNHTGEVVVVAEGGRSSSSGNENPLFESH